MSKLDELIAELCPDGVEYIKLGDILKIKNGSDYKKFGIGEIPVYGTGGIMTYIDTAAYNMPSVLIPRKGSLDKLYYVDKPFWTVDTIFYTVIDAYKAVPKYVYYCLEKKHLENLNKAGGVPSLTQSQLNKVVIPLPPLPVQQEVVRILDSFTEYKAELEAELEARKKQYEYYRNSLLSFEGDESVKWMKLGDVATDIYRGSGIKRDQVTENGAPCVRYGEIYTSYNIWFDKCISHTDEAIISSKKYFEYGDILFAITGESVEEIAKSIVYVGKEKCLVGGDIVVLKHKQNPKYLAYALSTTDAQKQKSQGKVKSKVVHSSVPAIKEIIVPIPSLDKQHQIADILDRFDALCNDITTGLPAEIAVRQKQYEYYRDKLLTFKEKV